MKLYKHQQQAVDEAMAAVTFGSKNVIIDAITGFGKSLVIAELCKCLNGKVVVLVNIEPLIDQIAEHLDLLKVDYSILKAGREAEYDENHRVHIVMSQTFYARVDSVNIECDYLIQDEVHREYKTDRTNAVMRKLQPKSRIGLTSTPYDQNGYALLDSEIVNTISVKELEEGGYLTPVKYYVPKFATNLGLEDLRMSGNDYSGTAIDEKMNTDAYMSNVVAAMNHMNAKNKKTLVFCNSIEQAEMINEYLLKNDYKSAVIHSKKNNDYNSNVLKAFKEGTSEEKDKAIVTLGYEVKCLCSVSKLTTGFSVKDVELMTMLRPTKVRSLAMQCIGRGVRTYKDKKYVEFLDLAGVVAEHGFHDEPYNPPEYGDKTALADAKASAEASALSGIVSEDPTEVTREKVVEYVAELKRKEKQIHQLKMEELGSLYEQTSCIRTIIHIAYQINKLKTGVDYKESTVDWITENWEAHIALEPDYKVKWTKALKTRCKTIVKEGKKLASLYYFIQFLDENKEKQWYGVDIR